MTDSTIVNYGTFTVANARQIMDASPPNVATGVLQPTSAFFNDGSFTKSAGTAATTIIVAFINQGNLSFNGGVIQFGSTLQQTGAGAVTDLGGGTMTLTGANPTFLLSAGELTGAAGATINGSLTNSGLVDFGVRLRRPDDHGRLYADGQGTLTINIGAGGQFDSLNISGFANLGGHLQVTGVQWEPPPTSSSKPAAAADAFADVTAPWTAVYDTDPVWDVSIE